MSTEERPEDQRAQRLAKLDAVRAAGIDPYPVRFDRTLTLAEFRDRYDNRLAAGQELDPHESVAGRLLLIRRQGKLTFATLRDGTGTVQLFVSDDVIGADEHARFDQLDLGDWIGLTGLPMKTKRGELSIKVTAFQLLAKALRPLPDKWHGLADIDTRFRQRYVDLIANDDARRVFEIRFAAVAAIRRSLTERGFVEVETPVLHPVAGGGAAEPFVTHHNALDIDLYLRIALELPLKRLLVAGFEKVFEIGRVFRNEGLGWRWQPEFTMLELYEALVDYTEMMTLTEEMVADAARAAIGGTVVDVEGATIDLTPPWQRRTMLDLIREHGGVEVHPAMPVEKLERICDDLGVSREKGWDPGKLVMEIYEKTTEPNLIGPVFVLDYPRDVSPLARPHRDDSALVERFEAQAELAAKGDVEAHGFDHDYLRALEYGLPPCGGLGVGIDRLAMLLSGVSTIREVILFPHLRPEADEAD